MQPLIFLQLLFRSRKVPSYRYRLAERYGFCKNKVSHKGILLHAVSVGEVVSSISLIQELRKNYPLLPITVTTMTPAGSDRVISTFGKEVNHVYLPYDLPVSMKHFLDILQPTFVIIMETEIWPNMITMLYQRNIPIVIANARLSDRSVKKYYKLKKFMGNLLNKITLIAVQNEEEAKRFLSLGIKSNQISITGNLKFDFSITSELINNVEMLRIRWASRRLIWIASSTHSGEENIILQAHQKLLKNFPDLLLILVPRHPDRFKDVYKIVRKSNFIFNLRSSGKNPSENTQVIIGDTMGELMLLYGIADLAFVGGSLVKAGGHNPLEPAAYSIPIIMGPYTFNFQNICNKLHNSNSLITVTNVNSIITEVSSLLLNKKLRLYYGHQAYRVLSQNRGALSRLLDLLKPYLSSL